MSRIIPRAPVEIIAATKERNLVHLLSLRIVLSILMPVARFLDSNPPELDIERIIEPTSSDLIEKSAMFSANNDFFLILFLYSVLFLFLFLCGTAIVILLIQWNKISCE